MSWAGVDEDAVIAIGGAVDADDGLVVWVLFTDRFHLRHMIGLVRSIRCVLVNCRDVPVYADIDPNFPESARLARLLGFEAFREVVMPDGRHMTRMKAIV